MVRAALTRRGARGAGVSIMRGIIREATRRRRAPGATAPACWYSSRREFNTGGRAAPRGAESHLPRSSVARGPRHQHYPGPGTAAGRGAGPPAARRAGAVGRRRARHGTHRRAEGAGTAARAGRCDRRHQHGRGGGRTVRERSVGARYRTHHDLHQLAGCVPRQAAARGPDPAPQAGGRDLPGELPARPAWRPDHTAAGTDPGSAADRDPAAPDAAGGALQQFRRSADPVPCRRDRSGDGRGGGDGMRAI